MYFRSKHIHYRICVKFHIWYHKDDLCHVMFYLKIKTQICIDYFTPGNLLINVLIFKIMIVV
ncbi:hypothetical protein [Candidatus Gullanella endobia]|uniref:hypothetical protein n=1 Tax=Candidatus Gullanella endobia TaxID=1070130 RepID=UPI0009EF5E8B